MDRENSFGARVYAKDPKSLILVPDICTSCNLEVHSVELFSKYPMEKLSKKRIYLTAQSGTSVALLRVLCSQYFQIQPEYVSDLADADAALFIGDEALKRKMQNDWPYCFDLAKLWREWKNLPFVFGAWSVHRSALRTSPAAQNFFGKFTAIDCRIS